MSVYNIVTEDEGSVEYSFLKDPVLVSSVESFLDNIETNGIISKNMVVSLEETIADKVITDKFSLNMFTEEPSKLGVQEAKQVIKNVLNNDYVAREVKYTINDTANKLTELVVLFNSIISDLENINDNIDLELVERIKSDEIKKFNYKNELVSIRELDIVDLLRDYLYQDTLLKIFDNSAIRTINSYYEKNNEVTPDMVFLRLLSLCNIEKEEEYYNNTIKLIINNLERYSVGDVVDRISDISKLINILVKIKLSCIERYRELNNNNNYTNKHISELYTMLCRIHDILKEDQSIDYFRLFTKQ